MENNCKIGKVKMKRGGADLYLIKSDRTIFHDSVDALSKNINKTTQAVGFFILDKDGTIKPGASYESGFTAAQLKGACEHMKDWLMDIIFENH